MREVGAEVTGLASLVAFLAGSGLGVQLLFRRTRAGLLGLGVEAIAAVLAAVTWLLGRRPEAELLFLGGALLLLGGFGAAALVRLGRLGLAPGGVRGRLAGAAVSIAASAGFGLLVIGPGRARAVGVLFGLAGLGCLGLGSFAAWAPAAAQRTALTRRSGATLGETRRTGVWLACTGVVVATTGGAWMFGAVRFGACLLLGAAAAALVSVGMHCLRSDRRRGRTNAAMAFGVALICVALVLGAAFRVTWRV